MIAEPRLAPVAAFPVSVLCLLLGIAAALWLTGRRWRAHGGTEGDLWAIAVWAIPAGIIGGRLHHVFSTPETYLGPGGDPIDALRVWDGGLGIWGAVALGTFAAWAVCRTRGLRLTAFLDAVAPGLLLAQALGRCGDWLDHGLQGDPSAVSWGPILVFGSLWNAVGCLLLIWGGRRFALRAGQTFSLYLCYCATGLLSIEVLRIGAAERTLGPHPEVWTSILALALGTLLLIVSRRRHDAGEDVACAHPPEHADSAPEAREQTAGSRGFGFFGAVTSTISIVPQLQSRSDDETWRTDEEDSV